MNGYLVNLHLYFNSTDVYSSPISSEIKIQKKSDIINYKLPVSLGSILIKVMVNKKYIYKETQINLKNIEKICFILEKSSANSNSITLPTMAVEVPIEEIGVINTKGEFSFETCP